MGIAATTAALLAAAFVLYVRRRRRLRREARDAVAVSLVDARCAEAGLPLLSHVQADDALVEALAAGVHPGPGAEPLMWMLAAWRDETRSRRGGAPTEPSSQPGVRLAWSRPGPPRR